MHVLATARPRCSLPVPPAVPTPSPRPASACSAPISTMRRLQQAAVAAGETWDCQCARSLCPDLPSASSARKYVEMGNASKLLVDPAALCCRSGSARSQQQRASGGGSLHVAGCAILQQVSIDRGWHRVLVRFS